MPHGYADFILHLFCKTVFTFTLVTTVEETLKKVICPKSRPDLKHGNWKAQVTFSSAFSPIFKKP